MILYEALMRCSYCGTRMFHKLRTDEVAALQQKKPPKRLWPVAPVGFHPPHC